MLKGQSRLSLEEIKGMKGEDLHSSKEELTGKAAVQDGVR
jgi:hypothetical protein